MTFTIYESSRKSGSPIDLYLFRTGIGSASYFAYTNNESAIVFDDGSGLGPLTYEPIAINRGKIAAQGNLDKTRLDIRMANTTGLAIFLKTSFASSVLTCVVYNGHVTDPDAEFIAAWTGRILSAKNEPPEMVLTGEPVITAMRRSGLRRHYQIGCPHVLYDQEDGSCLADIDAVSQTATVASFSGSLVVLEPGWEGPIDAAKFKNGGRLEWDTAGGDHEIRTIRRIATDNLRLNAPVREMTVGMSVTVIPGCNHKINDCTDLHKTILGNPNIVNYGGQRRIPTSSPLGLRNNYF
jgi:hypothetical protein